MRKTTLLISAMLCASAVWAQTPDQDFDPNQPPAQDPPSRVARLNLIQGQVSFQPATVNEWTEATLNYPVTIGDHLYADDQSRAELHLGSTAIRVGPRSGMSFLNLDDRVVQIRLDQGALIIRIKRMDGDDAYEVDTAQGAISLLQPGEYRIDTDPDRNATMVTVRVGQASVATNGGDSPVYARQTGYFSGDGQPQFQGENPNDPFDLWAMQQDRNEDRLPAPRYVSADMPGWQDLETNGTWADTPDYGPVWRPRVVAAEWAPYRYGHWAWVDPWGWTWIDDAPWGFAPFHYGRWAMYEGTWVWVPGPIAPRPVYAPALVAFVGGRNFSLAIGVGGGVGAVAWFPLGPREVYVPAYHVSPVYINRVNVTRVNITNITVVNRTYVNQAVGVTAVDHRTFVSATPVHRAMVAVPRDAVERATVVRTAAVAPERVSVLARPAPATNVPRPAARVIERPVFAQRPPAAPPVPFAARQQALQANPGRPVDPRTVNQLRTTAPVVQPPVRTLPAREAGQQPANLNPRQRPDQPVQPSRPIAPAPDQNQQPRDRQRPVDRPTFNQPPVQRPDVQRPDVQRPEVQRPIERPPVNQPPVQRPEVQRPVERPVQPRPVEQPPRREERPAAPPQPVQRPEPQARPVERPAERPAERPVERPAAREERPAPRQEQRPAPKTDNKKKEEK